MTLATAHSATQNVSRPAAAHVEALARSAAVKRALDWFATNSEWITQQHVRINEVPAPTFLEKSRGALVKRLLEGTGLRLRVDELGNVIGELPGRDAKEKGAVLVAAHLDTVFPPGTNVSVRRESGRLIGPGISDNAAGLASVVALAHALHAARIRPRMTIVFSANVGEEGEGNLRGMRKLAETYRGRLNAVIAVDGASIEHVTSMALASRRFEVSVVGPGGHSWSDFGLPNPIHALSRGLAQFVKVRVPENPRTSFNVGVIEGGTSVNSIPHYVSVKVDLRSESEAEIERLENVLRTTIQAGVEEEINAARDRGVASRNGGKLEARFRLLGSRPGGELPTDSPLLAIVREADRIVGNRSRLERSSTDANIPLSLGIPAIAVGGGGRGGGAHSLNEWYDPAGREVGLRRLLLILLGVSGVEQ
jgi:acetylornithine deacetylase/succinyl-diaminopimelate desuccinylase-like protein